MLAAYDAAKRFLKGEIVEKIPTVRSSGERVPLKTPRKQKPQNSNEGVMSKGLLFKPGDAVIVDTTVGMWPALVRIHRQLLYLIIYNCSFVKLVWINI